MKNISLNIGTNIDALFLEVHYLIRIKYSVGRIVTFDNIQSGIRILRSSINFMLRRSL